MNSIYIGDRLLDPPEDDDLECPCGSHVYTINGSCMHCGYEFEDCMTDPGEPNDPPDEG